MLATGARSADTGDQKNVDRVGTHQCPNGEALGSLGHGLDGYFWAGGFGVVLL